MLDFVEAGMTQMLIGYSFYDMGYYGVKNLVKAIKGEPYEKEIILDASNSLTTKENLAEIRKTKLPW
jgi:ABC-type sugar transport system substrate-binding protein